MAIVAVGNATRAVQPHQIWIELDCLAVVCDRGLPSVFFRDQPLPEERLTPLAETKGVFRIDCDRLGDIGDRLVEFTLFHPRHAAAGIGPRIPGIDPDRLGVVGQRSVVFMQTVIGDATVVVGPAIFRIDLDRLGAIGNGGDVVLLALVGLAPVRKGGGVLRAELDGLAVVGNRAVVILAVEGAAAPVLEGLDAFRHRLACIVDDAAAGREPMSALSALAAHSPRSAGVAASAGIASSRAMQRSSPPDPRAAMLFPSRQALRRDTSGREDFSPNGRLSAIGNPCPRWVNGDGLAVGRSLDAGADQIGDDGCWLNVVGVRVGP